MKPARSTATLLTLIVGALLSGTLMVTPASAATYSHVCSGYTTVHNQWDDFSTQVCITLIKTTHNNAITRVDVKSHSLRGSGFSATAAVTEYSRNSTNTTTYATSYGTQSQQSWRAVTDITATKTLPSHASMWFAVTVTIHDQDYHTYKFIAHSPVTHVV